MTRPAIGQRVRSSGSEPPAERCEPSHRWTMIRLSQVVSRTGLGRSTIYAQVGAGVFPPNIPLGARAVGWLESEVDAVIAARAAGAAEHEVRELVTSLVTARHRIPGELPRRLR